MKMLPNGSLVMDTIKDVKQAISTLNEVVGDLQVLYDDEPPVEGVLPDGTPIADILEELKDKRAQIADMKHLGRQIASQTLPGNQMNAAWRTGIHILAIKIGKI